ncbi:hypothetical protein FOZ63_033379 [Perkinsus olseni]|uniref:Uncharacterized protein n=1 Tax=Perkinsus olseni TaxID=32597 RepID=A0A7J6UQI7_PEROL|nr:hypothetical protein FOZ63_033379 [Perkinsus olseni]
MEYFRVWLHGPVVTRASQVNSFFPPHARYTLRFIAQSPTAVLPSSEAPSASAPNDWQFNAVCIPRAAVDEHTKAFPNQLYTRSSRKVTRHHQPPPKRVQAGSLVSADRQINSVIILIHYDEDVPDSRTYMEYDSLSSAMDGICRLYESALSDALAPRGEREDVSPSVEGERKRQRSVNYSAQDLFNYIDSMAAMKAFISHKATENGRVSRKATSNGFEDMLAPRGIKWIKENLIKHLRSQLDAPSMPPYTSTTAQ